MTNELIELAERLEQYFAGRHDNDEVLPEAAAMLRKLAEQEPVAWLVPQAKAGDLPDVFNNQAEARAFVNSQYGATYPQPLIVAPGYPYRAAPVPAIDVDEAMRLHDIAARAYEAKGIPTGELYRGIAHDQWQAARAALAAYLKGQR